MGFGTDFRTRQTPENNSNCSNLGTVSVFVLISVPVFILVLVPSLGLEPRLGLVRCRGIGFSFSWIPVWGLVLVPVLGSSVSLSFRMGFEPVQVLVLVLVLVPVLVLMAVYVCGYPRFSSRHT